MTERGPAAHEELARIGVSVRERFSAQKRVLSFEEYLALFEAHPWRHSRDASRYLRDCFDHWGVESLPGPGGSRQRFRLFDLPFLRGRNPLGRHDHLVGHEDIQRAFYRELCNFVREGRVNRLVMLHGPNGSAKSTFVQCIMRAMEHYAETDEGSAYMFSWIFPRGRDGRTVGFGSTDDSFSQSESFAHLPESAVDLRLASEVRESPLMLLPRDERQRLVRDAYARAGIDEVPTAQLLDGQLGAKNRQVFEALLTAYRGDLRRVLMHVRVERIYVSERYRVGAVTVGPQVAVDAQERQITADRSLAALPASLASLALFETHGELVEARGGILEFSDLLKRPLDAWRYLLLAVEEGEIPLHASVLPLDTVFVATSNDVHLKAFREHHEYRSFRGRLSLVQVPYLLNPREEQQIYDSQIVPQVRTHVAPHATFVAALWAVLGRLARPRAEAFASARLGTLAASLTPLEKADFYMDLRVPSRFAQDDAQVLRAGHDQVRAAPTGRPEVEGGSGPSPREVRTLLLDAAQDPDFSCLSPLAVLRRIRELCDADDYDFLKETPDGGYHDHRGFIEVVRARWLDRVDDEFRRSTGLVDEAKYTETFERYITHVSFWLKRERFVNPMTGQDEEANAAFMSSVEAMLGGVQDVDAFRRNIMSQIAGHAIDHPGAKIEIEAVFPRLLEQLREATFGARRKQLAEIARDVLAVSHEAADGLEVGRVERARGVMRRMEDEHGYAVPSIRDAVGELVQRRYQR